MIRAEFKRVFSAKSFWLVCGIMLALPLYEGGWFLFYRRTGSIVTAWWEIYLSVIQAALFLLPFLVMLPWALSYRRERDCGYSQFMILRSTRRAYLGAKTLAAASSAFMAVLMPLLCWMPICRLLGTADPAHDRNRHNIHFALFFYDQNPGLYCVLYTLYVALVGAVFAIFGLGISAVLKNRYFALIVPFGYCVFSGIFLSSSLEAFLLLEPQNYYSDRFPLGYWTAPLYMAALTAAGLGMLALGDYRASFRRKQIIFSDLNLRVERGISCAVLGEDGAGKSTLLKMICGLVRPAGGEVIVEGCGPVQAGRFSLRGGRAGRFSKDMGAVLDGAGFLPDETGLKNLAILAEIRRKVTREDLEETMRLVGLDPALETEVRKYPPELKQRLALAQALMEKPSLLLLDEPFQNIDRDRGERLRQLLERLNIGEGVTILMTARRLEDTWGLCGSVYEIVSGGLRKVGEREREWQALIDHCIS